MLYTIMKSISNFFYIHDQHRQVVADTGEFTIENGIIKPVAQKYHPGQFVRILGSVFNTGVYQIERVGDRYIDMALLSEDYPLWVAPSGTIGLYSIGDRVTHNGNRYVSLVDNNSWEPGMDERLWLLVDAAAHSLIDEVFTGAICPLAVPRGFFELVGDINRFIVAERADKNAGRVVSEKFADYSYTLASTGQSGAAISWQETFASRLHPYRKMRDEFTL